MKKITLLLTALFALFVGVKAETIWSEYFTDDNGVGATFVENTSSIVVSSPISGKWSVEASGLNAVDDWFKVNTISSTVYFEGVGVGTEATWTSESIDISSYINVAISMDVFEVGTLETSDSIAAYYVLDGGAEVLFGSIADDFGDSSFSVASLNASSLVIKVKVLNGNDENHRFNNILVTGDDASAPIKPTITNFLPAEATTFTLGESFNVSAIVTTTFGSIDSVRFAYGTESSNLDDTSKMMQNVLNQDSFYLPMSIGDEGTYYGQVIAYGSNSTTKSSSITSVIAECGVVEVPVASAASEILTTSFTANWAASTGALGYLLDVWTEESTSEVVYVSSDFDDGVSPLPTDWTDNDKVYTTSAGFNGNGLKLGTADISGVLTSPLFSVSESFSVIFYAKQYGTSEKTITVSYGMQNQEITTLTEEWQEQIVDFTAESGAKSVSFSAGRAYLDSVIVKSGGITKNYVLLGDSVKFGTLKVVTGLPENTTYKYDVSAYNAYGCESDRSNVISVTTGTPTALNNEVSTLQVFTNEGQIIVRSTEQVILQVYDISGRQVAHQLFNDQVTIAVKSGIYILKANETITKVLVK